MSNNMTEIRKEATERKDIIIYVSSLEAVQDFKRRCRQILESISIGALSSIGDGDTDRAFRDIASVMANGMARWVAFDLKSCDELIGQEKFIEKIKWLIRNEARPTFKTSVFIIDREAMYDHETRNLLAKFMVNVIDDEKEIGTPFNKMLGVSEADILAAAEESDAFAGLVNDDSTEQDRLAPEENKKNLPGMRAGTPDSIARTYNDPFAGLLDESDYDPFSDSSAIIAKNDDRVGSRDSSDGEGTCNVFAILDDSDLFGDDDGATARRDIPHEHTDNTAANVNSSTGSSLNGATLSSTDNSFTGVEPNALVTSALANDEACFDPFSLFPDDASGLGGMISAARNNSLNNDSKYIFDSDELAGSAVDIDPFADYDDMEEQSDFSNSGRIDDIDWYDEADDERYAGETYDNRHVEVLDVDDRTDRSIWNENGTLRLDWLFDKYGDLLGADDAGKLVSMREPVWDYKIENNEGVGGAGIAGLLGGKNKVSQVDASMLADSNYIAEKTERDGYYAPPDANGAKIILSYSSKGGTGKALPNDCLMLVENGAGEIVKKHVRDITMSDKLFGRDGKRYPIRGIYDQGVLPIYKLNLDDGRSIEASGNHIWRVVDDYGNELDKTTDEIIATGARCKQGYYSISSYSVPVSERLDYGERVAEHVVSPYDYGASLSDNSYQIAPDNSVIASEYMYGSAKDRIEMLNGFLRFDIDAEHDTLELAVNNAPLLADLCAVLRSLGYYVLRDGNKITAELGKRFARIVSIEHVDAMKECTCFEVASPDHLFVAGDFVVTHNTTVSVMAATQLNWYFNSALMQHMTASINSRVLLMSFNEFDDLPAHEIGYDTLDANEMDNDGRNVLELLRRINQTDGMTTWDDISHCFAVTPKNMVFYLPPLTQKQAIEDNIVITAEDYQKILGVLSKFFSFIIIDSPDIFYREKEDLMNFAFSIADVILFVLEASFSGTNNLRLLMDSLHMSDKSDDPNEMALDPRKCILVVNKYVDRGNPYIAVPEGQIKFEDITKSLRKYFARFVPIPYSKPRMFGNVLFGTDSKVKYQAAELADDILEVIDANDEREQKKNMHRRKARK